MGSAVGVALSGHFYPQRPICRGRSLGSSWPDDPFVLGLFRVATSAGWKGVRPRLPAVLGGARLSVGPPKADL